MIKTTAMLQEELRQYADPYEKIRGLRKKSALYPVTRGIYETDGALSGYLLAPVIYGPSYLSFTFALSYYGLIPEAVYEYTSAVTRKGKRKHYKNYFGEYSYRDVPPAVFPYGVQMLEEQGYTFTIASPEKALCDTLYTLSPIHNQKEIDALLLDDLRIDRDAIRQMNRSDLRLLCPLYHCQNTNLFLKWFLKGEK